MKMLGRMALLGLAACAAAALVIAPVVTLQAAEAVAVAAVPASPVAVVEPTWWQNLLLQIQQPLSLIVTAILGTVGAIMVPLIQKSLGNGAARAINQVYQIMADQAAGWLIAHLHAVATPSSNVVGQPEATVSTSGARTGLNEAVEYARTSYPEVFKKLPNIGDGELAKDILAAAGKMLPGKAGGIASAIGGLMGAIKTR